jgi:hypothetical protein
MATPLYYNDSSDRTVYDVAREISILAGRIRMMNPNLYATEGVAALHQITDTSLELLNHMATESTKDGTDGSCDQGC